MKLASRWYALVVCGLLVIVVAACTKPAEEEPAEDPKPNILTEYVKTPLDKAHGVEDQLEDRNRQMQEVLEATAE